MAFINSIPSTTSIATGDIQADAITNAKIADDAINSEHYTDGSIDTAPTLTTTAAKGDLFVFRYNGAKYLEVGRNTALTLS